MQIGSLPTQRGIGHRLLTRDGVLLLVLLLCSYVTLSKSNNPSGPPSFSTLKQPG